MIRSGGSVIEGVEDCLEFLVLNGVGGVVDGDGEMMRGVGEGDRDCGGWRCKVEGV